MSEIEDYEKGIKATEKVLDSLNILAYTRQEESVYALMDRLEEACSGMEELKKEPFEGFLFNWMCESEFEDYLRKRYGTKFLYYDTRVYYLRKENKQ